MYALNIDKETNRILSVCVVLPNGNYDGIPVVDTLPEGDVSEYLYVNNEYVYDPQPKPEVVVEPSQLDKIEAQTFYTAMMTDTLLEV